jgi:hypothetical protein
VEAKGNSKLLWRTLPTDSCKLASWQCSVSQREIPKPGFGPRPCVDISYPRCSLFLSRLGLAGRAVFQRWNSLVPREGQGMEKVCVNTRAYHY